MHPTEALFNEWVSELSHVGIARPAAEVSRIIRHVLMVDTALSDNQEDFTHFDLLTADIASLIAPLISRRALRVPFERLFELTTFEEVEIEVQADVFQPYPETGVMVQHAVILLEARSGPLRLLDVGTGSGCILLALLRALENTSGIGIDPNPKAIALARRNAARNGLLGRSTFQVASWEKAHIGAFDLVISNAPRVATDDIQHLTPEMRDHDPHDALDGGPDGLDFHRNLARDLHRYLKKNGIALFQAGPRSAEAIGDIFAHEGFDVAIKHDYAGRPACVHVQSLQKPRSWWPFSQRS